jgi:hypothetical protein
MLMWHSSLLATPSGNHYSAQCCGREQEGGDSKPHNCSYPGCCCDNLYAFSCLACVYLLYTFLDFLFG